MLEPLSSDPVDDANSDGQLTVTDTPGQVLAGQALQH